MVSVLRRKAKEAAGLEVRLEQCTWATVTWPGREPAVTRHAEDQVSAMLQAPPRMWLKAWGPSSSSAEDTGNNSGASGERMEHLPQQRSAVARPRILEAQGAGGALGNLPSDRLVFGFSTLNIGMVTLGEGHASPGEPGGSHECGPEPTRMMSPNSRVGQHDGQSHRRPRPGSM